MNDLHKVLHKVAHKVRTKCTKSCHYSVCVPLLEGTHTVCVQG